MKSLLLFLALFISSVLYAQCPILSEIQSTTPVAVDGIIEICTGDSIDFTAVSMPNYSHEWDFEGLGIQYGETVTQQFNASGGYFIKLTTTDQSSCSLTSTDLLTVVVFEQSTIECVTSHNQICLGDSVTIDKINEPQLVCDDAAFVSGTTFLPDGVATSYETSIMIDCFPAGAILSNTNSFLGVCMNIEHSYVGDLEIVLIAPNGRVLTLLSYPNNAAGTFFGEPVDDVSLVPGIGYDYCFTSQASNDLDNRPTSGTYLSGNYMSASNFNALINVPLNGQWTLRITDNLAADNGYIFEWFMQFGAGLQSNNNYSSSQTNREIWATNPDVNNQSNSEVIITPSAAGINCYTYLSLNPNGVSSIEQLCIEVRDPQTDFLAVDLYIYDSDANGTEDFNLAFNTDRLIGNMNPVTTVINYYTTLVDAQSQSNPIANPSSFANTTNPQTIYAVVENTHLLCQNVLVDFELVSTSQPVTDSDNDTIPDLSEDLNGNGDLTDDDTDMDGIPNYLDNDDDGDGVPTALETNGVGARGTNFFYLDTDGDGIENYLDNDDDGDGLLTQDEDYNGNGDPTDDDTDGSGIPDFLESNVTLSTESLSSDNIVVYPNPFYEDRFEIRYSRIKENELMIHLYNMNGASIFKQKFQINSSGTLKIETPSLSSGVYFLQIGSDKSSVFKLIKK